MNEQVTHDLKKQGIEPDFSINLTKYGFKKSFTAFLVKESNEMLKQTVFQLEKHIIKSED
jgi:hypothetical protein